MLARTLLITLFLFSTTGPVAPNAVRFVGVAHAKPDHADKEKGGKRAMHGRSDRHEKNRHGGKWAPSESTQASNWTRDWGLGDFLAAGLTAAVVRSLLGDDSAVLHTGAKPLPPGIAKNLARGKPLPPGIAKKQPGTALTRVLPRIDGHEWLEIGTSLVLVEVGTRIVRDIVDAVFD